MWLHNVAKTWGDVTLLEWKQPYPDQNNLWSDCYVFSARAAQMNGIPGRTSHQCHPGATHLIIKPSSLKDCIFVCNLNTNTNANTNTNSNTSISHQCHPGASLLSLKHLQWKIVLIQIQIHIKKYNYIFKFKYAQIWAQAISASSHLSLTPVSTGQNPSVNKTLDQWPSSNVSPDLKPAVH